MRGKIGEKNITPKSVKFKIFSIAVAALTFILVVTAYFGVVFGWMASNREVQGNIYATVTEGVNIRFETTLDDPSSADAEWREYNGNALVLTDMYPGGVHSKTVNVRLTNLDETVYTSKLELRSNRSGSEVPLVIDDEYYYLGSQIKLSSVEIISGNSGIISGAGTFLVTTTALNGGQVNSVAEEVQNIGTVSAASNIVLDEGGVVVMKLTFVFADNGQAQNAYQSFSGRCSRQLYVNTDT